MPSQSPGYFVSFGWKTSLLLLVLAPPMLAWDRYKTWRWQRRNEKAPRL